MNRAERLDDKQQNGKEFFEIILTRTDDHEFVGVVRSNTSHGMVTNVESGERLSDVIRQLVDDQSKSEALI